MKKQYHTLRLILGDQLNAQHSWYKENSSDILYIIAELHQETDYVTHHIQKVCAFFNAMDNFAKALIKAKHHVLHFTLDDTTSFPSLDALITHLCKKYSIKTFEYQRPDEYRLHQQLIALSMPPAVKSIEYDTEHFLLNVEDIPLYFEPGKHQTMEFFYRKMRQQYRILLDEDNKPLGGKWNYDANNRQKIKPKEIDDIPQPLVFSNNIKAIKERLLRHQVVTIGHADDNLIWPTTRQQAKQLLKHFCEVCLPFFGKYQDTMTCNSRHQWSLYHSRLSFALNAKILHPLQVIQAAVRAFDKNREHIDLAQIEGFVRQILGWREYIRGIYWQNMPAYQQLNHFKANKKLPDYFWTANTKMNCMRNAIEQSLEYAYAHHIQRLMITGNFCLLTGIDPTDVDEWYLGIYIDAIEWVEMPNTRGMSQFADGGIIATKPYAAGGNYINKMSDYCKQCDYDIKLKSASQACPFNSLYWGFMIKHREELSKNPRVGMIYRNWDKQTDKNKRDILARAKWCLSHIDQL